MGAAALPWIRIATLYDRLGVGPGASHPEIRAAYRRLARRVHPDRGSAGSESAMADINEAWRILGDPVRRASYDANLARPAPLAPSTPPAPGPPAEDDDEALEPAPRWVFFPWALVLVVLVGIFIFTAYARGGDTESPPQSTVPVDGTIAAGSCVALDATARASEVDCAAPHIGIVSAVVAVASPCPLSTEGFYDVPGTSLICITRD